MSNALALLLSERYGENVSWEALAEEFSELAGADAILGHLLAHRSVRHFLPTVLPSGALTRLVAAAQSASSSSNLQTWSVVAVEDTARRARAAELCADQAFIREAPLFLVFCADLSRLTFVSDAAGLPGEGLEYTEMFLMAAIDAALAAQNAAVAAEAEGLGICYVGAARNRPAELAAFLDLPARVFAVFGMAVGYPDPQAPPAAVKPRLPQQAVLHRETYQEEARSEAITAYDEVLGEFHRREGIESGGSWSRRSARRVATVADLRGRHLLQQQLQQRGFDLR